MSSYKKLSHVSLAECGFTGTIPESYCMFTGTLNNNSLTGFWPQCKICYFDNFEESFDGNPSLEKGNCGMYYKLKIKNKIYMILY